MSEEIPYIQLDLAGEEFRATPLNSQLFTFAGRTVLENGMTVENSTFNHVFLNTHESDDPEVMRGTYIFQPEVVKKMGEAMVQWGFPARLNQREVQPCDISAYQTYIEQNAAYEAEHMEDEIPDWMLDGNPETD